MGLAVLWLVLVALPFGVLRDEWAPAWPAVGMLISGIPLYLLVGPGDGRE